jgi:hypothetical protein
LSKKEKYVFSVFKGDDLNLLYKEVNHPDSSPSVRIPWANILAFCRSIGNKIKLITLASD